MIALIIIGCILLIGLLISVSGNSVERVTAVASYLQPLGAKGTYPKYKWDALMQQTQMEYEGELHPVNFKRDYSIFVTAGRFHSSTALEKKTLIATTHENLWDNEQNLNVVNKKNIIIAHRSYDDNLSYVSNFLVRSWVLVKIPYGMDWSNIIEMLTKLAKDIVAHPEYNKYNRQKVWYKSDDDIIRAFITSATKYVKKYLNTAHPNANDYKLAIYSTLYPDEYESENAWLHICPACKVLSGETIMTLTQKTN